MFHTTSIMLFWLLAAGAAVEADYVIRNAQIHDGSGSAATSGDVAIKGDRIVAVGQFEAAGSPRVIDGTGLVVAPGFIDLHNHSDGPITKPETRLNKNFLTQGVTTIVTGNCGGGRVDVAEYLKQIDEAGAGTNVAHLIPQGSVRGKVLGSEKRPAGPDELSRMKTLVDEGMRAGAWGMSSGLIYVPSAYADTSELVEVASVVSRHGGIYVSHMRNENTRLLESVEETLTIGRRAGLPVHISHFKASGRAAWGLAAEAVRLVQQAREEGQPVTADQYPYIASSTSLAATVVPEEYREKKQLGDALADPEKGAKVREQIERKIASHADGTCLFIAGYAKNRSWQGKDLATIAQQQNKTVLELVLEIQQNGGAGIVNFGMNEEEVRLIMQQRFVATASDGSARNPDDTIPHPRNYGCFPRKIGGYAIEGKLIPLEQAIRSCTGLPADILGLPQRGYLKEGYFADLVVFDPQTFRDTATFQQPHQYSTGVRYLLVNGKLAIDDGKITEALPGKALRHESAAKGGE